MSWRPDWRNFGDGNRFQRLVNDLLRAHLAGRGTFEPHELPQDGGFDAYYEGFLHNLQGRFRIQTTFQIAKNLPNLKTKVVKEASRRPPGATHLLFVTNADLRRSEVAGLQRAGTKTGIPTIVLHGAWVEGLLRDHPSVATKYFPQATCAFVGLETWVEGTGLAPRGEPPLAPRLSEFADDLLATIRRSVRSENRSLVVLIIGNRGAGKTRVLQRLGSIAAQAGEFNVRFWRPGFVPVGAALEREIPVLRDDGRRAGTPRFLLVFDDAERLGDEGGLAASLGAVREFALRAQGGGQPVAVCLATTPVQADAGFASVRRPAEDGFLERRIPEVPLPQRVTMLRSRGVSGPAATAIAQLAGDDLGLAMLMAHRARGTNRIPAPDEVLAADAGAGAKASARRLGIDLPRLERLLGLLAAFEPVAPSSTPIADAIAREARVEAWWVRNALARLEADGAVRRVHSEYRFRVPLQATAYLHRMLRDEGETAGALVERLIGVRGAETRVSANLAQVIAAERSNLLPDAVGRVMDRWAESVRGLRVRDRMSLLAAVRTLAPFVPEKAMAVFESCLQSEPPPADSSDPLEQLLPERSDWQLGPLVGVAAAVMGVQGFAARGLRGLRAIAEKGRHPRGGAGPCATSAAEHLAYSRASSANIAEAATELSAWLNDDGLPAESAEIIRHVASAWLSSTWRSRYFDGEALHVREGPLPHDPFVADVRQQAIGLLVGLAAHRESHVRRDTWKSLGWYGQTGWYRGPLAPGIARAIREEASQLVRLAAERWSVEGEQWGVSAEMERFLLRTLARDDVEELVDEVRRTLVGLTRPPRYRAYRLLVDRDWYVEDLARVAEPGLAWKQVVDRLHEDMVRGFDREARRPLAEAVAAEVADPPGLLCFLREVDAQAPAQGGWGYGDLLVALLGDVHPEWWPAVAGTDGGGGPLPPRFQRLVRAMQSQLDLAGLKAAAATVIARPDAMPEDEVVRIVEALWKSPESPDVAALLERLAEHPSVRVREAIVQSLLLSGYRESSPAGAATALRKALRDPVSLELLDRASQGVGDPRYGIPAGPELSVLRAALLDRLATWPNLDLHHAYWLRQFMGRLCEASVDEFLELLDERLRREPVARPPADAEWRHAWIPGGLFDPSGDPPIPPLRRDTTRRVQQWLVDRWLDATNAGRHGPAWHIEMALTEVAGGTKEGPGVGASVALSLVEAWMDAGDLDRAAVLLRGMPATKETIDAGVRFLVAARSREFTGRPASATFRALVRVKQVVMRAMYAPSAEAMTRRSLLEQAVSDARAGSLPVAVLQVLEAALVEVERGIEEDQADHRDQ